MTDPIVLTRIDKRFGAVQALAGAGVVLRRGRVGAIVGENGAGKSTLAKIIAGMVARDAGDLVIDGAAIGAWSRAQAIAAGVGFVPQSLSFVATLSIVDNHVLSGRGWRLDRANARRDLAAAALMQVALDLDTPTERLSLPERQLGEIVCALAGGARVLLLDEPTSALGPLEVDRLIRTLRRLAASGATIGLVTHRIAEVMQGADDITVLRAGRVVMQGETAGLDADAVARLMVGERNRAPSRRPPAAGDQRRLTVADLFVRDADKTLLDGVSLSVRQGEILAIAGVAGPSQPALAEAIAGLRKPSAGRICVDGVDVSGDAGQAAAAGLAYIPETRAEAIVGGLTVAETASLMTLRPGLRRRAAERATGARVVAAFDVRPPDPKALAGGLSGGNQQKLLVGRELIAKPKVLVVHGPTQGLDVAAAAAIRSDLVKAAADGAAVLVLSADLDELLGLAHRLLVLTNGRVAGEFDLCAEIDMTAIAQAMAGLDARKSAA